jgi:hypothetical protein
VFNDADRAAVLAAIGTIREKLPFLVDLSPEEEKELAKMGAKRRAMVKRAVTFVQQNPTVIPETFEKPEFLQDWALFQQMAPVVAEVMKLQELVDDTMKALSADLYASALTVYLLAKAAGRGEGLDALLDLMGNSFARQARMAGVTRPPPSP